ncbi:MAG TPA: outer membrane beta-barrel protein [Polyangiaceae bacterium]|nr:outer membrane beta-barrel protein [Polyangiaceae bacterium]
MKRIGLALVFLALLTPATASAFEHQHHLGVDAGVAFISIDQKPTLSIGGGGGIHYSYGLNDAFNFLVEGAFCPVALQEDPEPKHNRPTMIENLGVGIAYTLDVVRWVPYIGVLASGFTLHGGSVDGVRVNAGATIAAGLDYQVTRGPKHLSVGVAVRQHFMLSDLADYPSYTQIFLRAEYVWGF